MKKIVLCPNPTRDRELAYTNRVKERLEGMGAKVSICTSFVRNHIADNENGLQSQIEGADILICFGGDGTILHLSHAASRLDIPILTVNMGNKGFIAELETDDFERLIDVALSDEYRTQSRMMLDVCVKRRGEPIFNDCALNDAVIVGLARIIHPVIFADGEKITEFSGDGIIVSTPTGSTAYSMSAGGPIVEPTSENIVITPVCSHALIAKSFVLSPVREVTVALPRLREETAYLSVDGGRFELEEGDEIIIRKSRYVTKLIKASVRSFYEILNDKLGDR